jgi:WD40 repeat protein
MFATGGGDDLVRVFKLGSTGTSVEAKELFTLKGHEDSIVGVKFSNDGKLLASAGYDACVKIWNSYSGELIQTLSGPADSIDWISWHKKGNVILAGAADATAWMWLASTGACMQVFAGHEDAVSCGDFSGDGKKVVTGSVDGSARVWNPKTGECQHVFKAGSHGWHNEGIVSLATHHGDKPLMICGGLDGTARLAQIQLNKPLATFSHESTEHAGELYGVEAVGFSHINDWAASGAMDGSFKIWDVPGLRCRQTIKHPAGVIKLHWHESAPLVLTACADAVVRLWDARSGVIAREYVGHRDVLLDLATVFEKDGSGYILTGCDDKSAKIFQVLLPTL